MSARHFSFQRKRFACETLAVAMAFAGATACKGGGSPGGPSNTGGGASCRTVAAASRSVQTFVDGQVVSTDMSCTFNGTTDVTCQGSYTDTFGGPGTITQTSRFASKNDIVDEAATNPPRSLSLGTTTVITTGGVSFTITATNSYDSQRRLVSTRVVTPTPVGDITATTTFTAWDGSGRPTSGTLASSPGGTFPVSITYDNPNRSVTRNTGLNICTVTHDGQGIIIKEVCTGTTDSTTNVTIASTTQICK